MAETIRKARLDDVPAMVELAEQKRLMYQEFRVSILWVEIPTLCASGTRRFHA
jgi:hypothetical protein